jgi:translocation and assembly module TamB
MPTLNVKFINKPEKKVEDIYKKVVPYPIHLNINIKSTDNIFAKGRGIDARLKGEVKLKGTYPEIQPIGQFKLVKGTFLFSGRYFDLTEGTIVSSKIPNALPIISVQAETIQKGILLIASLKGPLNAPILSFSSSPPLSLSSIISLLLFGDDLSGISALQALQVATTIASLSEGSGLLETAKKNLGIDRLAVVSKTGEDIDDPDQIAVEVGKYITRGFLVSFKQGTLENSSNVSVEIDIGKGFIVQLETIREEEQSKGTLKWSHNF